MRLAMSALGHKQTYAPQQAMSAIPPIATAKADMPQWWCPLHPWKRTVRRKGRCPLRAN